MGAQRRLFGAAVLAGLIASASGGAFAAETAALYNAYWAGLPAGDIRLVLRDDPAGYRDEIAIRSEGLAWLFTKFRGTATAEGRLAPDRTPSPSHYEAHYDLRKARGKRQTMRFVSRASAVFADRGPDDTSQRPQLAEEFRKNVVDPLSALTAIRHELRRGNRGSFTVPGEGADVAVDLARGHARSGDACEIRGYCGSGEKMAKALRDFASQYADQTEADYGAFVAAIRSGKIKVAKDAG